jgi:hypothetical protein
LQVERPVNQDNTVVLFTCTADNEDRYIYNMLFYQDFLALFGLADHLLQQLLTSTISDCASLYETFQQFDTTYHDTANDDDSTVVDCCFATNRDQLSRFLPLLHWNKHFVERDNTAWFSPELLCFLAPRKPFTIEDELFQDMLSISPSLVQAVETANDALTMLTATFATVSDTRLPADIATVLAPRDACHPLVSAVCDSLSALCDIHLAHTLGCQDAFDSSHDEALCIHRQQRYTDAFCYCLSPRHKMERVDTPYAGTLDKATPEFANNKDSLRIICWIDIVIERGKIFYCTTTVLLLYSTGTTVYGTGTSTGTARPLCTFFSLSPLPTCIYH